MPSTAFWMLLTAKKTGEEPEGMSRSRKSKRRENFYASALTEAEQARLPEAKEVEGLDEEMALLRVKLASLLESQPENMALLLRGIALLVQATKARYRLSPQAEEDLYQSVLGVLRGVGGALGLDDLDGAS